MSRQGSDGRIHARLSASESFRWINCPGSVREIEALPEELRRKSSEAAEEGTAAHELGEKCLLDGTDAHDHLGEVVGKRKDHPGYEVDEDMADAVQVYLDVCRSIMDEFPDGDFTVEKGFNLKWIHPDCFGTNDFCAVALFNTLVVVDYKHGKGVLVDVEENTQLMYYALGAAKELDFNFDEVRLVVVQPRCRAGGDGDGVREWTMTASELEAWGEDVLRPAAYATEDPDAPLNPGDWCKKNFCPKQSTCPALIELNQELAFVDFNEDPYEPPGIGHNGAPADGQTPEEYGELMANLLAWAPKMKAFWSKVEKDAYVAARSGLVIPGHKIVNKESDRSWVDDEKKLKVKLKKLGVAEEDMYAPPPPPKLKSPAQMEKISNEVKKAIKTMGLTERLSSGMTLVPESDKRPAADISLENEFEPFDEDIID